MWFRGSGIIEYDPIRQGINSTDSNGRQNRDKWWVIVRVNSEICRYYRWWISKEILNPLGFERRKDAIRNGFHFIDLPSWGPHISVLRGERPRDDLMYLWKKYDGRRVEFDYSHKIECEGDYFFVEVRSDFLTNIRKELELPIGYRFHITVGRMWRD
ncbi:MAG: hypothetical protein HC836_25785 [Richelia sp. RM2_1_2]|nr:hypothetical protein [Richelia sp. RM2_1_2]